MFHRWAALLLVLALCAMKPKNAAGQTQTQAQPPRGQKSGAFGKAYPNPSNPDFRIPFSVDTVGGCRDGSRQNVVSIRISNILSQEIAIPKLESGTINSTTSVPSSLVGALVSNVKLGCGDYQAYWNGKVKGTTKDAASGTYVVQLIVNGKASDGIRIMLRK
jgi:hypothetical protein